LRAIDLDDPGSGIHQAHRSWDARTFPEVTKADAVSRSYFPRRGR
jgi:hypothetical protein